MNEKEMMKKAETLNVRIPETNTSNAQLGIRIGELSYAGVTLKNVEAHASSVVTDENVKVQCDTVMKFLGQLVAKFGDSVNDLIRAEVENTKARKKFYEAQIRALDNHTTTTSEAPAPEEE